ncbi:unnamed protein product [Pylaiella littoralis]
MKITMCLAALPLAAQAALSSSAWFGGRGLALVVKRSEKDFTFATRDGGSNSASFRGEAPKGGTLFRGAADAARDTVKDVEDKFKHKDIIPENNDGPARVGPFWESKIFKEGGLGFLFGVGTGVCVRKVNQKAACAVGGVMVAAQYVSRTDALGLGGKLGWPVLDAYKLRISDRERFGFAFRSGRTFKHTVEQSLETCGGYALGLAVGLKGPLP